MKKSKKKHNNILIVLIIIIIVIGLCSFLFYNSYMNKVDITFSNIKDTVKTSKVLNEKYGSIKEVKYNNFMKWLTKKENYECLEMTIKTSNSNKNICTIVKYEESLNMYIIDGYEIDGKILND